MVTEIAVDAETAERLRAAIGRIQRRLRRTRAGEGLTPSEISVLFTIVGRGPLGISELAELEALNPTMLSRIVAELCQRGLVRREAHARDRRAATVSATAAGRRLRERVQRERARTLGQQLAALEPPTRELLLAALPALEELAELL
jgi:DNA-binding MarR family transcriptional regulator